MIVAPFFPREFDNKILQQNNFIIGPLGPPVVAGFVNSSAYSFLRARAHFSRSSVSANGFRCDSVSIAFSFFSVGQLEALYDLYLYCTAWFPLHYLSSLSLTGIGL